jgi:ribosomal protein L5
MEHHAIDVMHVEKNVCEALVGSKSLEESIGTLADILGKTKDALNARMDLEEFMLRKDLHHETFENVSKKTSNNFLHPK